MAGNMKILLIWGHKFRPWGYEVRVDLQDESGKIHNEVLNFPVRSEKDILDRDAVSKAADELAVQLATRLAVQEDELAREPGRRAMEVKNEFMLAVSAGLIKADDLVNDLEPYVTVKPELAPVKEII